MISLCAAFPSRVTVSPPELGGEPEGRGGLNKAQHLTINCQLSTVNFNYRISL